MLLLLHSKLLGLLPKRFIFLCKLWVVTACAHLLVLLVAFCVRSTSDTLHFVEEMAADAEIVFLPLVKKAASLHPQSNRAPEVGIAGAPPALEQVIEKKAQTTLIAQKAIAPKSALCQKNEKNITSGVKQKVEQKKVKSKKEVAKEPPKQLQKKIESPAKKAEPNQQNAGSQAPVVKETEKKVVALSRADHKNIPQKDNKKDQADHSKNVIYMGSIDKENKGLADLLKEGIAKEWKRPAGLLNNVMYQALLEVDCKGMVSIKQEKKSGALVLDAAARSFIINYRFPKSVWGRHIEVLL